MIPVVPPSKSIFSTLIFVDEFTIEAKMKVTAIAINMMKAYVISFLKGIFINQVLLIIEAIYGGILESPTISSASRTASLSSITPSP